MATQSELRQKMERIQALQRETKELIESNNRKIEKLARRRVNLERLVEPMAKLNRNQMDLAIRAGEIALAAGDTDTDDPEVLEPMIDKATKPSVKILRDMKTLEKLLDEMLSAV